MRKSKAISEINATAVKYKQPAVPDATNQPGNPTAKPEPVYCVECGAATELDCICDDLNFADGERISINGELYQRVAE